MHGLHVGSQLEQHWVTPAAVAAASAPAAAVAATAAAGGPVCTDRHMGPSTAAAAAGQTCTSPSPDMGRGGGLAGREKQGVYPKNIYV